MGYLHVYTGDGKGKTTAAFGLLLRAHYAGWTVYVGQFVKDMAYHETMVVQDLKDITIEQLGRGCFIERAPEAEDIALAAQGMRHCAEILASGTYRLVVLDELTIALCYKLISPEMVMEALDKRHPDVEVVITGRYAPQWLIDRADVVTEMREVKHYYATQGLEARDGIER